MCTQQTYFRTLCEWTLCNPPPRCKAGLEGHNWRKAVAPPSVCVDIYIDETDERTRRNPLPPQVNTDHAVREWPREEKREETCCSSRFMDSKPQQWEYKSRPGGKVQQMHPKEQNDAVNCFDLKKEKGSFFLFLCSRLKHLLMH